MDMMITTSAICYAFVDLPRAAYTPSSQKAVKPCYPH